MSLDEGDGNAAGSGECHPDELEEKLGYAFRSRGLLLEALTHRSLLNEIPGEDRRDNERLEFLGDAVLGLIVSEWLMEEFPEEQEGELTRLRSVLVQEKQLSRVSRSLDLGRYLHLGKGEARMNGREKPSVLADAFEALVAAVYLDGGTGAAREIVRKLLAPFLSGMREDCRIVADPKTRVQEMLLAFFHTPPAYRVVEEQGPDHDKTFFVNLCVQDVNLSSGQGKSKKEAEQDAADRLLLKLERNPLGFR